MMTNRFPARFAPILAALALGLAAAYFTASMVARGPPGPVSPGPRFTASGLAMATCTGGLAETPDTEFTIPLDQCDKAIDAIDVQSGFLSKWTICGGAKSFEIVLQPRAVKVTSDAFHCSSARSAVSVTFIGPLKR